MGSGMGRLGLGVLFELVVVAVICTTSKQFLVVSHELPVNPKGRGVVQAMAGVCNVAKSNISAGDLAPNILFCV